MKITEEVRDLAECAEADISYWEGKPGGAISIQPTDGINTGTRKAETEAEALEILQNMIEIAEEFNEEAGQ